MLLSCIHWGLNLYQCVTALHWLIPTEKYKFQGIHLFLLPNVRSKARKIEEGILSQPLWQLLGLDWLAHLVVRLVELVVRGCNTIILLVLNTS